MASAENETVLTENLLYERLREFHSDLFTYKGVEGTRLGTFNKSSVLVPIFLRDHVLHVLLTKRSSNLRTHKGEVSFPGGKKDEADADEIETCLREAEEEIGLSRSSVKIISHLPPRVTRNKMGVFPVVGLIPPDFVPRPNPDEVESVFSLPLSRFLMDVRHSAGSFPIPNKGLVGMFHIFNDTVGEETFKTWGLTANIIIELAVIILRQLPDFDYDPNAQISVKNPFAAQFFFLKQSNYLPSHRL